MRLITEIHSPSVQIYSPREVLGWASSGSHADCCGQRVGLRDWQPSQSSAWQRGSHSKKLVCSKTREEIRAEKHISCLLK